jgi:hypothetical protein
MLQAALAVNKLTLRDMPLTYNKNNMTKPVKIKCLGCRLASAR